MSTSLMNIEVELLKPGTGLGAFGQEMPLSYKKAFPEKVMAQRLSVTARQRSVRAGFFAEGRTCYRLHYHYRGISEGWRIREKESGDEYAVYDTEERREFNYVDVSCEKVMP